MSGFPGFSFSNFLLIYPTTIEYAHISNALAISFDQSSTKTGRKSLSGGLVTRDGSERRSTRISLSIFCSFLGRQRWYTTKEYILTFHQLIISWSKASKSLSFQVVFIAICIIPSRENHAWNPKYLEGNFQCVCKLKGIRLTHWWWDKGYHILSAKIF